MQSPQTRRSNDVRYIAHVRLWSRWVQCAAEVSASGTCIHHRAKVPTAPWGRYVMTAVCAAARHFHTDGPLAWNNPLIKGFLDYQPLLRPLLPKPPPPHFFSRSYTFKGIPPSSKGNYSPTEFIQKPPHTHTHTQGSLIPHVHSGCGPWCKCGRAGHFSAVWV